MLRLIPVTCKSHPPLRELTDKRQARPLPIGPIFTPFVRLDLKRRLPQSGIFSALFGLGNQYFVFVFQFLGGQIFETYVGTILGRKDRFSGSSEHIPTVYSSINPNVTA